MSLVVKLVVGIIVVVVVVYLGAMLVAWRELQYDKRKCRQYEEELAQLENGYRSTQIAIGLIEEDAKKHDGQLSSFQERKLADMIKSKERNRARAKKAQEELVRHRSSQEDNTEVLRRLKTFAWLRKQNRQ